MCAACWLQANASVQPAAPACIPRDSRGGRSICCCNCGCSLPCERAIGCQLPCAAAAAAACRCGNAVTFGAASPQLLFLLWLCLLLPVLLLL
jgi:hypothetical protein